MVFLTFNGCGQSSPPPEQGEKEDVEKAIGKEKPEVTPKPETAKKW